MNINISLQSNWVAEDILLFASDGVGVVIRCSEYYDLFKTPL